MKNRLFNARGIATLVMFFSGTAAHSTTLYWDLNGATANTAVAATGAWNGTNAFWNNAATGTGGTAQATTLNSDDLIFSSGSTYTTGTITASGTRVASSISFEDNIVLTVAGAVSVGGTGTKSGIFVLSGNNAANTMSGAITLATASTIQNAGTGVLSLTGGILGTQNLTLQNNSTTASGITISTATLNNTGTVTNSGAGSGGVLISSVIGTNVTGLTQNSATSGLTLSGVNTFTGPTNITAGSVTISNASGLGGTSGISISSGGQLVVTAVSPTFASPKTLSISGTGTGSAGVVQTSGATANINWNGAVTLTGNALVHPNGNGTFNIGGSLDLGAFDLTFSPDGSNNNTFTGTVTGTGKIIKGSTATLALSGANTSFSGGVSIIAGTVTTSGNAAALGTGTVLLGDTTGSTGANLNTGATALTFANNVTVRAGSSGTKTLGHTGAAAVNYSGGFTLDGNLNVNTTSTGLLTISGNMGGVGSVTKSSNGTLSLTGSNDYAGNTFINAGTLSISSTGSLPGWNVSGRYNVATGAILAFPNSIADSEVDTMLGTTNFADGARIGFDTTAGNRTYTPNLTNTTQGALGIVKLGPNTLTLAGNSTFTGLTTVSAGSLLVSSPSNLVGLATNGNLSISGTSTLVVPNTLSESNLTTILGTSSLASGATLAFDTTAGDRTYGSAVTNSAAGTINLTKISANTLTLTGANSYTGATNVTTGTLVAGGGSAAAGVLTIGNSADNAVLNIPTGGTMSGSYFTVGTTATSAAAINIKGGALTMAASSDNDLSTFGSGNGGYGAFTMSSGSYSQQRFMFGGNTSTAGTGVGLITGGNLRSTGWMVLSRIGASKGILTITGGTIDHSFANNTLSLGLAGSGRAELNVAGGLINNTGRNLTFSGGTTGAFHWSGTGLLNVNAGTLITNAIAYDSGSPDGKSYVNFNGGILKSSSSTASFLPAFTPSGTGTNSVFVNGAFGTFSGGASIDTNGFNNTISANLLAPSGNGVTGLTITDPGSGYIGAPAVSILDDGAPSTATAYAVVNTDPLHADFGKITSIVLTNPGVITGTASVVLTGGGGTGAAMSVSTGANTSGGLTKLGAGTLTLSGANTYTGTTTVSAGTLNVGESGTLATTSNLTVNSGAKFTYNPTTPGTLAIGALNLAGGSTIGASFGSTIATTGAATIGGTVDLALSGTFVSGDTYTLLTAGSGLTASNFNILNSTNYAFTKTSDGTSLQLVPTAQTPLTSAYWLGGLSDGPKVWASSNGSTASNWTTDGAGAATPLVPGAGANVIFSDASALAGNQVGMTLGADMSIGGLTVNSTNPVSLLKSGYANLTLGGNGITLGASAGATTLNTDIILGGAQTWTNDSSSPLTLGGTVSGGANLLTVGGTGTTAFADFAGGSGGLTVSSGTTTISSGNLAAAQTWTNNSTSAMNIATVHNGGVLLTLGGTGDTTVTGTISGTGGLTKSGAGSLLLSGGNTFTGVTRVGSGTATAGGGGTLVISGANPGMTGNVLVGNGGTLRLQSANALGTTGGTNSQLQLFTSSTVQLRSDDSTVFQGTNGIGGLNNASITIDVDRLESGANKKLTFTPGISAIGNAVTLNLTGANGYTVGLGTFQSVTGAATVLTLNPTTTSASLVGYQNLGNTTNSSTLTLGGTSTGNTVTGAITNQATGSTGTGIVAVSKSGASSWTLSGANTYTGATNVTAGTLTLSGSLVCASAGGFIVNGSSAIANIEGTLNYTGGAGGIAVNNGGVINFSGTASSAGSGELIIGNASAGSFNMSAGSFDIATTGTGAAPVTTPATLTGVRVGNGTAGQGTLAISGGTLSTGTGCEFLVGFSSNTTGAVATGTVNVSGTGVLNIGNGSSRVFIGGNDNTTAVGGSGTLSISGNGEVNVGATTAAVPNNAFFLGGYTGQGTLNLDGGTFSTARPFGKGTSSTCTINFNGGVFKMGGTVATVIPATFVFNNVRDGGAKFDTNGTNTIVAAALAHSVVPGDAAIDGGLVKTGNGTLTLSGTNTYNGSTVISGGTLGVSTSANLGDAASGLVFDGGTLQVTGTALTTISGLGHSVTLTADKTVGLDINNAANTFTGDRIFDQGIGGLTKLGAGALVLDQVNTYTGPTTISAGNLNVATLPDIGTAGPLGVGDATDASTNSASLVFNGGALSYTSTTGTTNRGFTTAGAGTVRLNSSDSTLTITGKATGSGSFTLAGAGSPGNNALGGSTQNVLTLSGGTDSGLTGNIGISNGGIKITNSNALGSGTKTVNMTAGSSGNSNLQLDGSGGALTLPSTFTYNVSNSSSNGRGTIINLAGNNSVQGQINITSGGGGFYANSEAGNLTIAANISATTGTRAVALGGSSTGDVTGVISNGSTVALPLQKSGTGTWILSGANTHSGATAISEGILSVGSINSVAGGAADSHLGAPTTVANGTIALGGNSLVLGAPITSLTTSGTLKYTGSGETTDRVVNLTGTTGGGVPDQSGSGLLKFTSALTATGVGSKTLTLQGSTSGTGEIAGAIVNNLTGTNNTSVEKTGTGAWILSGANTYTGSTTVTAGTLSLTDDVLADTAPLTVATGAVLNLNYTGTDIVSSLTLGGVVKPNGIYHSGNSGGLITGTGKIQVGTVANNFESWAIANGIAGEPATGEFADSDKDGLSNLVEYALGLDPKVANASPGTFNGQLLSFNKGTDAVTNGDVLYQIEESTGLAGWVIVTPLVNDPEKISYQLPAGLSKQFARLKVTLQP